MTTSAKIDQLIKQRELGDATAQAKIDVLFEQYREETKELRAARDLELAQGNAIIYGMD